MPAQNQKQPAQTSIEGTVMALAVSPTIAFDGTLFAVTEEGVLYVSDDRAATWRRVQLPGSGMAMSVATSPTFATDNYVWASLPEGAIYWSPDRGKTWRDSMATRVMSQTVGMAASPNLAADGIVLAATLDDGIFRSTDRGRTWSPGNFGLLDLKTMGVVLAPDFTTEQVALAATESGIYRSRNGGLSWKEVGFWEDAVQCAAFSPSFAADRCAWAGCEQSGLTRLYRWRPDMGENRGIPSGEYQQPGGCASPRHVAGGRDRRGCVREQGSRQEVAVGSA